MDCRPLLALALAGLLAACQPPPPREALAAEQVRLQAARLSGLCAQGAMLAELVQQQRVSGAFPWVEQQAVAGEAQQVMSELSRPAGPREREAQRDLLQLAIEMQVTVTRIGVAQDEDATLRDVRARLEAIGARAKRFGKAAG